MKFKLLESQLKESVDAQGNILTTEQEQFFKNSKMRDANGNLLVFYHGSPAKNIQVFHTYSNDRPNSFFSQSKDYAKEYSYNWDTDEAGEIYEVYLNICNPFDINNLECQKLYQIITGHPFHNKMTIVDTDIIYQYLKTNNTLYDAIIANEELTPTHIKKYGESANTSYVPLNSNQIKSIYNYQPTLSNNINEEIDFMKFKLCENRQNDTITLEYPKLCINYDDKYIYLQDYDYDIEHDDVIYHIENNMEKLIDKYPEWNNLYDMSYEEYNNIEPQVIQFIENHFDELFVMYEKDLLNSYEDAAREQAEEDYNPDDYVDWDNLPGGHDYM